MKPCTKPRTPHCLIAIARRRYNDFHHVDGDGKADAIAASRLRIDRGIDTDQVAIHINKRTARIARINRGICLNKKLIIGARNLRTRKRGHNARGYRLPDAKGITDGQYEIADVNRIRIAELNGGQTFDAFQPQDRKIAAWIA